MSEGEGCKIIFTFAPMAKEEDRIEEKQKQENQQFLQASKVEAIIKECQISPSQDEILQQIPHCKHQHLSHSTTSSPSHLSSRDFLTVGAHPTTFCSPEETQQNPHSNAEEEEEEEEEDEEEEERSLFDPKFESDRDESQSQSLNTQSLDLNKPLSIFNSPLQTPLKTKALPLQEAASANSKLCNRTPLQNKPSSCRRRLKGPSEEMTKSAKSPPDLAAAETLIDNPQSNSEMNYAHLFDSQDFNQLDTQTFHSLGQVETSGLAAKLAEVDEKGKNQSWGEEIRARRISPLFYSAMQREISSPTVLENEISLEPKRQHTVAVAKPYPNILMDVIMNWSGEPPEGYEDADVVEAALNAGITFPPPLSRHNYCK